MNSTERSRFTILVIILVILVIAGIAVSRFRRGSDVGADALGVIQNQAQATYKSEDGLELTSVSDISELTVSGGVSTFTLNYKLEARKDQTVTMNIQFFRPGDDTPLITLAGKQGNNGLLQGTLKNIPNGVYDIAVKPQHYLSQALLNVEYVNGQVNAYEFKEPFKIGDVDVSGGDNVINGADYGVVVSAYNQAGSPETDFNQDDKVNAFDISYILRNFANSGSRYSVQSEKAASNPLPEL